MTRRFKSILLGMFVVLSFIVVGCASTKSNSASDGANLSEREQGDLQVIEDLKRNGSDLSKPHEIEHHFVIEDNDLKKAKNARDELAGLGYKVAEIEKDTSDGKEYLYFDAVKTSVVQPELIFSQTKAMEEIALKYKIIYDGWGTSIVK